MVTPVQIISLVFVTFAASRAILRAKDKKITLGELLFWMGVWSALVFVVFFPDVTTQVARLIGIGRGIDVIVYVSIALLFYLIFRLYVKIEEAESEITQLVREISLRDKKRKKKK